MTAEEIQEFLKDAIDWKAMEDDVLVRTRTFEEAGVMTYNKGLVVHDAESDTEFQISIVRSR